MEPPPAPISISSIVDEALLACRLEAVADQWLAVVDDAQLRRRAAHVEGQHRLGGAAVAEEGAGERAGGRAGFQQLDRRALRLAHMGQAAVRQHHEQRRADAECGDLAAQIVQIPVGDRLDVGVRDRRRGALELADLRRDLRRDRHEEVGKPFAQDRLRGALVGRVGIGVQEHHGDRHHAGIACAWRTRPASSSGISGVPSGAIRSATSIRRPRRTRGFGISMKMS